MRTARLAIVCVLAATLPAAGDALEWTARAGVDYWRQTVRSEGLTQTNTPRFDLNLALDLRGFVVQPELATWRGGVEYRRLRSSYEGAPDNTTAGFAYNLETTLFGSRSSPFTVTAVAALADDDISTGSGPSGTLQTRTYGADARLRLPDRPRVGFGYTRSEARQDNPVLGVSRVDRDRFTASVGHGTPLYNYSADYSGVLSTGTYASDNADEHRARVSSSVVLDRRVRLQLSDSFYRRTPTLTAAVNPRQDLNHFDLRLMDLRDRDPRDPTSRSYQEATYSYTTGFTEFPDRPLTSRTAHRAAYSTEQRLPAEEWSIRGTVATTYEEDRVGDSSDRVAGQTLGALAYWRRQREGVFAELNAGPTFGLLEQFDGVARFGYGGAAGALLQRALFAGNVRASYNIDYASNAGEPGWSLGQQLSLGADRPAWTGTIRGQLVGSARRADLPLLGTSASRSISGIGDWTSRRWLLELRLGVEDGLAGALRDAGAADALFIAPAYDSHTRYGSARASLAIIPELRLTALGRVTSTELPDRPSLSETEARAGIIYAYGGFGLSLEDQYVISRGAGVERRVNQVLFQVYRIIGGGQGYILR